ncbi:MAG: bifunctional methylenetetrahydrofolate dehydrogenase/methenyltetrahydrofolate cyclohydrolase FolD [Campylobacterales bacterium]|nr:bifunctional methylenetetrahydrofolate dehydrogenase/methenyltetrahydrofolate cyclohydrolase FolD [Campylobacterales bacterium]
MTLLDGKALSDTLKQTLKTHCETLKTNGIIPSLAVVLVGSDPASATYVGMKERSCEATGIRSIMHRLPESTTQETLLSLIETLNEDPQVDGILVQLPLPKHLDSDAILEAITPRKDVDGFHAINVGKLSQNLEGFVPCTPLGVMKLLEAYAIDPKGLDVCVIGRSNIVGKPMMNLLINAGATVTVCHSQTKDLKAHTLRADLLVVGVGKPALLKADMVKEGAIVIDVGINRTAQGTLVGDVDFDAVAPKCAFITPVPGGVGPMTIAMLLSNTVHAAKNR